MRFQSSISLQWAVLLLSGATVVRDAGAAWPRHPHVNLPIAAASDEQGEPAVVSDGAGGVIVAWHDRRSGANFDIYAQHVLASGVVDPAWPASGRILCAAAADQLEPLAVSDGAGGAIVAWQDFRSGNRDLYAQRVLASGVVDPGWPADGQALCTAALDQQETNLVSDGAGGAILVWQDNRSGTNFDVYAQRVLASGAVDPTWPVNGRALCTAVLDQSAPVAASDGASGAIVAWEDSRSGSADIYVQRVLASGAVDPGWPADGQALCTAASGQNVAVIVSDGVGGGIVAWQDFRSGTNLDIYAQRILVSGAVDPGWPVDGRAVGAAAGNQAEAGIASDGAGGAVLAWQDQRNGDNDIYAQHVLVSGAVDPGWPANGRALCVVADEQINCEVVSDAQGGAVAVWDDMRSGSAADVYAQHVLFSGVVDPSWPANGRALCTAPLDQTDPVVASDAAGGAIAAWQDLRNGVNTDVYAQRVERFGYLGSPEPAITGVQDVPNDQGGVVKLSWQASYLDTDPGAVVQEYWIFRSVPPDAAKSGLAGGHPAVPLGAARAVLAPGSLVAAAVASGTDYWEFLATVPAVRFLSGYSDVAPTTGDSVGTSNPLTRFMVVALDGTGALYWPSQSVGGYSVDNLPPETPSLFTGTFGGTFAHLSWRPNPEADLAGYRLHRGTSPLFVPGSGTLVSVQADTGYVDSVSQPYYYKLSALDRHGNESPFAFFAMPGALDATQDGAWSALALRVEASVGRSPVFRFAVPRPTELVLALFDARGRRVRTVWRGAADRGEHTRTWDGRDERGQLAPSGVYFARLTDGREVLQARIVRLR
jgi:hypothetical protein